MEAISLMSIVQVSNNQGYANSPFDSIRRVDEFGNEFWNGRELMEMLNYKKWDKFEDVIKIAQENLATIVDDVKFHITPTENLVKRPQGGGSKQSDFKLSRLACYHVSLCCDSRGNDAVKTAKHYFAVKTREAEIVQPSPVMPQTYIEALEALLASEKQKALMQAEQDLLKQENEALAEAVDELFEYSSIIRVAKFNAMNEKAFKWQKLKAATKVLGLEVKQVPCPRFETKNLYPHDAWRFCYPDVRLPETTTLVIKKDC
jgi:hypothetical protein